MIEQTADNTVQTLPYKFTAKERDEETGLYYYGARYLDPRTSRWLSADPALGDYIPQAPVNEEAKKANGNLPGLGGVYNTVNFHLYHYAGNNPVKYTDPDGKWVHIVIGVAVGGTISAGISIIKQKVETGSIDLGKTVVAFVGGAASGALAATGVGLVGQIIGNGVISTAGYLADERISNGNYDNVDVADFLINLATGLIAGLAGGPGANAGSKNLQSLGNQLFKRIGNAISHGNYGDIAKAMVNYARNSGTLNKELIKNILRASVPGAAKEIMTAKQVEDFTDKVIKQIERLK